MGDSVELRRPGAILVADRFAPLRAHLLALLAELGEADWERPTAAPGWRVKDVATHLLGGDVWILSGKRDGYRSTPPVEGYSEIVKMVDRLNREWAVAMRRLSPRLLRELLAFCGAEVDALFVSIPAMEMGGAVEWAGPEAAPVWFDVAREFTERWHHQQQIRDATNRAPLYDPYFFAPVLDTFARALPHAYREAEAPPGTTVRFEITGEAGSVWYVSSRVLTRTGGWTLWLDAPSEPATAVTLPQEIAWRLFTKGIARDEARRTARIEGRAELAAPIFAMTAIIG